MHDGVLAQSGLRDSALHELYGCMHAVHFTARPIYLQICISISRASLSGLFLRCIDAASQRNTSYLVRFAYLSTHHLTFLQDSLAMNSLIVYHVHFVNDCQTHPEHAASAYNTTLRKGGRGTYAQLHGGQWLTTPIS